MGEWRRLIEETYEAHSVPVLRSMGAGAPEGAGSVFVPLDDSSGGATEALIQAVQPRLAIIGNEDEAGFDVHLVSQTWLRVLYADPGAIGIGIETVEFDDDARQVVEAIVKKLASEVPLSHHGKAADARRLIEDRLSLEHPELASRILAAGRVELWDYANELQDSLKDRHTSALREDAKSLAAQIAEREDVDARLTRPVLREIVYSSLKRVDATCVTRASVEIIVLELDVLMKQR